MSNYPMLVRRSYHDPFTLGLGLGRRRGFREWTPPEVKKRTQQVPAVNSRKEGYAASSRGSRELKKENLTAPEPIATDLETSKDTESESDYIVIIMMCPIHGSVQ